MYNISYIPIGIIHSPFKESKGTPIQYSAAKDVEGTIDIFPEYLDGLDSLSGFSHIILIYHFHHAKKHSLKVIPFMDNKEHGVFSTRAPMRPNHIGFSIVKLDSVDNNILRISGLDILDGTPLLDIKPYVPEFDHIEANRTGWLEKNVKKLTKMEDDGRFI
jgi:tRNA-Thr(GGU) m(6)t(6)A37 methyltransferase TsaA